MEDIYEYPLIKKLADDLDKAVFNNMVNSLKDWEPQLKEAADKCDKALLDALNKDPNENDRVYYWDIPFKYRDENMTWSE